MEIKLYTKSSCPNCVAAKSFLNSKNVVYTEINLDNNEVKQEFLSKYPSVRTVPQIVIGEDLIGGLKEIQSYNF